MWFEDSWPLLTINQYDYIWFKDHWPLLIINPCELFTSVNHQHGTAETRTATTRRANDTVTWCKELVEPGKKKTCGVVNVGVMLLNTPGFAEDIWRSFVTFLMGNPSLGLSHPRQPAQWKFRLLFAWLHCGAKRWKKRFKQQQRGTIGISPTILGFDVI